MHGILTDSMILDGVETGKIKIDPFKREHLNPASYDLTLGRGVAVYHPWVETFRDGQSVDGSRFRERAGTIDVKVEPSIERFEIDPEQGWLLKPGIGYLMHTQERVSTLSYVPILDGKSSIGRLFLQVHATAGYGDPGFDGQFTLEVIVQHPIRIYLGMRICQIRFQEMAGSPQQTYDKVGHYKGEAALGAIPSQVWRQFSR